MRQSALAFAIGLTLSWVAIGCDVADSQAEQIQTHKTTSKTQSPKDHASRNKDVPTAEELEENLLKPDPPDGATAECVDGTYSYAKLKKDACLKQRGVATWLPDVRPKYK